MAILKFSRGESTSSSRKPSSMDITKKENGMGMSTEQKRIMTTMQNINISKVMIDSVCVAKTVDVVRSYIERAVNSRVIAIDVITVNEDYRSDIIGVGFYVGGAQALYVPLGHRKVVGAGAYEGNIGQDSFCEIIKDVFMSNKNICVYGCDLKRLVKLFRYHWGVEINPAYDVRIAAFVIDETDNRELSSLYKKYVDNNENMSSDIPKSIDKRYISPNKLGVLVGYNTIMIGKLAVSQMHELNKDGYDSKRKRLFYDIEMPLVKILADIEYRGWCFDTRLASELEEEYKIKVEMIDTKIAYELSKYELDMMQHPDIMRLTKNNIKNFKFSSSKQAQAFFYDILQLPIANQKAGKKCDKEALEFWVKNNNVELARLLLEQRKINKLYKDYIYKLYNAGKEGRIYSSFNQDGADTGRFSSSDVVSKINLQNIPKSDKRIRGMFVADDNYCLIGADYSSIEPRVLTYLCQDKHLLEANRTGLDLYSAMASKLYKKPYEECTEATLEGKKRRSSIKAIFLGLMYGRGVNSVAVDLGISKQEAQKLVEGFFKQYPRIQEYIQINVENVEEKGYAETLYGRRRHLNDLVIYKNDIQNSKYQDAYRKCLNSVVQGTAADIIKKAIIKIGHSSVLNKLGYVMLANIHDEIIGQAPVCNVGKCKEIVEALMIQAAREVVDVEIKVDTEISLNWGGESVG